MEIAKYLVAFVAIVNYGGLVADGLIPATARQHLWNPAWPPHAKFHNGQTMLMGVISGTLALVVLFAAGPLTVPLLLIAAAFAGNYFFAMALAPAFPGTAWADPEFTGTAGRPLGLHPQQVVSYVLCAIVILAVVLAVK